MEILSTNSNSFELGFKASSSRIHSKPFLLSERSPNDIRRSLNKTQMYSKPCQTSKMKNFAKTV